MITETSSLEEIKEAIAQEIGVMVYFSAPTCNVCKVLKPKIMALLEDEFPKIKMFSVDTSVSQDIAAHYHVFSIPTTLIFLDRREFLREGRNMSMGVFQSKLERVYTLLTED